MSKNKLKYKDFSYYDLSNNDLSNIRYTNFNCKNPNTKKKEYYRDDTTPILNDQLVLDWYDQVYPPLHSKVWVAV